MPVAIDILILRAHRSARTRSRRVRRLSEADVQRIRELEAAGWSQSRIATVCGCSQSSVSDVCRGLWYRRGHRLVSPGSRLSDSDVVEIRELWVLGVSQPRIAEAYQIAQSTVSRICRRLRHRSVPPSERELAELQVSLVESDLEIATTGRIQWWDGQAWQTYPDIRRAELASGLDRGVIASACLQKSSNWRYEPLAT